MGIDKCNIGVTEKRNLVMPGISFASCGVVHGLTRQDNPEDKVLHMKDVKEVVANAQDGIHG